MVNSLLNLGILSLEEFDGDDGNRDRLAAKLQFTRRPPVG